MPAVINVDSNPQDRVSAMTDRRMPFLFIFQWTPGKWRPAAEHPSVWALLWVSLPAKRAALLHCRLQVVKPPRPAS